MALGHLALGPNIKLNKVEHIETKYNNLKQGLQNLESIATLGPTWNSTEVEFQLASLNLQVGPQSGIIIVWNRPAGRPTTSMFEVLYLSFY